MSAEIITESAAAVARVRGPETTKAARTDRAPADKTERGAESEAARVSLDAQQEMDELAKVVADAPTEISRARLEDLASQVRNGEYRPGLDNIAYRILFELRALPDPPFESIP